MRHLLAPRTLFLLVWTAGVRATPEHVDAEIAWISEGRYCEPETVLALPDDTFLVSNVCDYRVTGSGFLTRLAATGEIVEWHAMGQLDAPLGMALAGERLYLIDANRVRVLSWPDLSSLKNIELETQIANDIAADASGNLYVTDTASGLVLRVDAEGEQSILTGQAQFPGANGIALDGTQLYVGGEALWRVDLERNVVSTAAPDWVTDIDGIEIEPDGTVQVTLVGGPLIRIFADDAIQMIADPRIESANHGFAPGLGLALIPTGFSNTVVAVRVPSSNPKTGR